MMKKLSKIALLAAASALMLAVFPACGDDEEEGGSNGGTPSVTIVKEDGAEATTETLEVEGTLNVQANVSDFPDGVTYEWESGNKAVATVTPNPENATHAQITALAEGETTIKVTATADDTTATAEVKVTVKAEGGGGAPTQSVATEASWNFVGTSADKDAGKKTYGGLEFDGTDVKKMSGTINADTGDLKIILGSTGQGTTSKTIGDGKGAESSNTYARFKPNNVQKGLVFKYDAIKIPDVKGKVKLTIVCYHAKANAMHQLDVTANGDTKSKNLSTGTETDPSTLEFDYNFEEPTPIYISTSEEFFIRTITIAAQ